MSVVGIATVETETGTEETDTLVVPVVRLVVLVGVTVTVAVEWIVTETEEITTTVEGAALAPVAAKETVLAGAVFATITGLDEATAAAAPGLPIAAIVPVGVTE